jgi:hypothetical protein
MLHSVPAGTQGQKISGEPSSDRQMVKSLYNRANYPVKWPAIRHNNKNKHLFNSLDMKYLNILGYV